MSLYPVHRFELPRSVELAEHRWHLDITVTDSDGTVHRVRASADSYHTDYSGIAVFEIDENGEEVTDR